MLPVLSVVGVTITSPLRYSELYRSPGRQSTTLIDGSKGKPYPLPRFNAFLTARTQFNVRVELLRQQAQAFERAFPTNAVIWIYPSSRRICRWPQCHRAESGKRASSANPIESRGVFRDFLIAESIHGFGTSSGFEHLSPLGEA